MSDDEQDLPRIELREEAHPSARIPLALPGFPLVGVARRDGAGIVFIPPPGIDRFVLPPSVLRALADAYDADASA